MQIAVRSEGFEMGPELEACVVSRLQTALAPFRIHLAGVTVRLSWPEGAGPGPMTCCARVDLRPHGGVAVRRTAWDVESVLAATAARLRPAVADELARRRAAAAVGLPAFHALID